MENAICVVGNLTRDPELRYTTGGRAVASLGLAVSRRYQRNGEWQEDTSFLNAVVWGQQGENAAASLTKGARVIVFGRMSQREYEKDDGEKRYVYEIVADAVGPDLKWATCQISRNERTQAAAPDEPGPIYGDEEPF